MHYYLLLIKYDQKWYPYFSYRDKRYDTKSETDRMWLEELARFAVEHLGIRTPDCNVIADAQLYPLFVRVKIDKSAEMELRTIPIDGIERIRMTNHE